MSLAGFVHIQIGYESASDTLLKKIEKKNSFASNLLFIKYAILFQIYVGGANIIKNLLEETEADILESIENLHNLRFFLHKELFEHNYSELGVTKASRYYKLIKGENEILWSKRHPFKSHLSDSYLPKGDPEFNILEAFKCYEHPLWYEFQRIESYYLKSKYEYKLILIDNKSVRYKEYYNERMINELEFETHSIEWKILDEANNKVVSLQNLTNLFGKPQEEIIDILNELKKERLIYINKDYTEIVSIINTNILI
ncbi:MAG: hypothetical protein LUG96_05260 [Tannerellaceae bacterium]|nr:hypothetical protein [Tannerellaceae bacterium]